MNAADTKILLAIRGYDGWTSDLEFAITAASRKGQLQRAFYAARRTYFAETAQDSGTTLELKVMPAREQPAFIAIFREELRKALSDRPPGLAERE